MGGVGNEVVRRNVQHMFARNGMGLRARIDE